MLGFWNAIALSPIMPAQPQTVRIPQEALIADAPCVYIYIYLFIYLYIHMYVCVCECIYRYIYIHSICYDV